MQPMPITDAMFLIGEARSKPMHVGGLQLFRPPEGAGPDYARQQYRGAIELGDPAPLFRRRATHSLGGLGPYEWCVDEDLDLEYHVRHSALPYPGRIRELLALVSRLHGTLLDRNRPLWETHVIEGLDDGRIATYNKVHHALIDGLSAMRWMASALSEDPDERDMPPPWALRRDRTPREPAGAIDTLVGVAKGSLEGTRAVGQAGIAAVRTATKALVDRTQALPYQAPRSVLNQPITGARRFAADSWPLERVQVVGKAHGASLNDVVLAMCAGALRRYLDEQDALPEAPLIAAVPVALRKGEDGPREGNAVGAVLCNLGTHLDDPGARFELVRTSMQDAKSQMSGMGQLGVTLLSAINFGPVALGPLFRYPVLRKPPFNIIISNVPGPKRPLYWNGARLEGVYPASIPFDGQALNITLTSYAGSLEFGIVGCRRQAPHLQRLLQHLETSLAELEALPA
jgi:diacylglycerol O-acyltransferase / wax synthase